MNISSRRILLLTLISSLLGCAGPTIQVATEKPIAVDITMRIDVYQHEPKNTNSSKSNSKATSASAASPESRRRNRMGDIQEFKNSRLVGESVEGLLVVLTPPPGDYGLYVKRMVQEENADRMDEMKTKAQKEKKSLSSVQAEQGAEWKNRAFTGEWIQVPVEGKTEVYEWKQKPGA